MKILHITPSYKPAYIYGGPILSVAKLCEVLVANGQVTEVFTTKANGKTELLSAGRTEIDGVNVRYFRRLTKDHTHFSPCLLWALHKTIRKSSINVVIHIHSWWNMVALVSCLIAKMAKVPIILSPRGMLSAYTFGNRNSKVKAVIHKFIGRHLLKHCIIHATSDLEKEDILRFSTPKGIQVIPNFINAPTNTVLSKPICNPKENFAQTFKLLYLSRVDEKKGLELLFHALANCNFSWSLTIAGTGHQSYLDRLKQLAEIFGISQYVTWLGHVSTIRKYKIIKDHHLLVLLSHNENFANVILESLSVGTPVAISCNVGLAEFVKTHNLGWVVKPEPRIIGEMLNDAYSDHQKRTSILQNAPTIVGEFFSERAILNQYLDLYKQT